MNLHLILNGLKILWHYKKLATLSLVLGSPYGTMTFQEGVALKITTDYGLDLNPHYFNYTDETIQGEVYLNLHASLPQDVVHETGILQLGNNNISLPQIKQQL